MVDTLPSTWIQGHFSFNVAFCQFACRYAHHWRVSLFEALKKGRARFRSSMESEPQVQQLSPRRKLLPPRRRGFEPGAGSLTGSLRVAGVGAIF